MKLNRKFAALLAALAMFGASAAACGENGDKPASDTPQTEAAAGGETAGEETEAASPLPSGDYGGYEFNLLQ